MTITKWLKYKGQIVGQVEYGKGTYRYSPKKPCLSPRDRIWWWLRRKITEFGFSYQKETGGIILLFPAGNEPPMSLNEVEDCIKWAYSKSMEKLP